MPPQRRAAAADPQPPRLPKHLHLVDSAAAQLAGHEVFYQSLFADCRFSGQTATTPVFEQVHFRRVDFARTRLASARFIDVRFEACDLSGVDWEKAHFRRVEIVGCRLLGAQFPDADLADTLVRDCTADLAFFGSARFTTTQFVHTSARETTFDEADLSQVVFEECDLSRANLRRARLNGADFRTSDIGGVQVGISALQGAIVNSLQAAHIASLLGLVVREAGEDERMANSE